MNFDFTFLLITLLLFLNFIPDVCDEKVSLLVNKNQFKLIQTGVNLFSLPQCCHTFKNVFGISVNVNILAVKSVFGLMFQRPMLNLN